MPQVTELATKLIKSYFNLYNLKLERKIRSSRLLSRLRKLSSNKIYVSNGEFKHTNNKVIIKLYFINKYKFNYNNLQYLKKYLEKIYNKNVEFNLVNLRRFYLNSDILSESITLKIRKNRRKLLKYLNTLKRKVKVRNKKNLYYKPTLNKLNNVDKKYLEGVILRDIKYKHVTGFRLEIS